MFKKLILTLACLSLFTTFSLAEVKIDPKHCVENIDPGYCAWAALETLGRHHQIAKLYNLTQNRTKEYDFEKKEDGEVVRYKWIRYPGGRKAAEEVNTGGLQAVSNKLSQLGVKFRIHDGYSTSLIRYAIKNNLGCVIACKSDGFYMEPGGSHAVVLTEFKGDVVKFIDSNDPWRVYTANVAWFDKYWIGYTIVVEK